MTRSAKLEFIRYLPDSREKMRRLNFHLDLTSILLHLHKKNPDDIFYFLNILLSFDPDNWTSLPLIFTEHPTSPCCRICFSPHKGLPMTWVAQEQNKSSIMSFGCQRKALFVYQVDKTLPKLTKRDPSWSFVVNDFQLPDAKRLQTYSEKRIACANKRLRQRQIFPTDEKNRFHGEKKWPLW